jgi:hypothetical protein
LLALRDRADFAVRTIVKEHRFELELQDLRGSAPEADKFIEAVEWTLARQCPIGMQVGTDPPIWFIPMVNEPRLTPLGIYYTFDDQTIHFLSIRISVSSDN